MTVWIPGAAGMLGQEVATVFSTAGHTVVKSDREVDITDPVVVKQFWSDHANIQWIVNCAAWTAVDDAEANEAPARRLNADGPKVLAESADEHQAAMVHISTDYVYSGTNHSPYLPSDPPDPQGAYGRTKLDGEHAVRTALKRHVIIRTAWLYGIGGKNFVSTMLRLMNTRAEIGIVADQYGLPTYAPDLAAAIRSVVLGCDSRDSREEDNSWGTYHYTNAPAEPSTHAGISWYDFAQAIYARGRETGAISSECHINALTTAEYPTPAVRPAYSVLDSSKIVQRFGADQPTWQDGLERFLAAYLPLNT